MIWGWKDGEGLGDGVDENYVFWLKGMFLKLSVFWVFWGWTGVVTNLEVWASCEVGWLWDCWDCWGCWGWVLTTVGWLMMIWGWFVLRLIDCWLLFWVLWVFWILVCCWGWGWIWGVWGGFWTTVWGIWGSFGTLITYLGWLFWLLTWLEAALLLFVYVIWVKGS